MSPLVQCQQKLQVLGHIDTALVGSSQHGISEVVSEHAAELEYLSIGWGLQYDAGGAIGGLVRQRDVSAAQGESRHVIGDELPLDPITLLDRKDRMRFVVGVIGAVGLMGLLVDVLPRRI